MADLVWTGKELLVWGNITPTTGVRYDLSADSWTAMTKLGSPKPRSSASAVWTGDSMLVVGGLEANPTKLTETILMYQLTRPLYLYGHR